MKNKIFLFLNVVFLFSCNNLSKSKLYQNNREYFNTLDSLSKNYVIVIVSTEFEFRQMLFDYYKINNIQFLSDSVQFLNGIRKVEKYDLKYVDFLLNDSILKNLNMIMIFNRSPFESNIRKWDNVDNKNLVQKVLIYDYFVDRSTKYQERMAHIAKINNFFDMNIFKKWYVEVKNMNIDQLKKDFATKFPAR